jgi:peroxiredoxin
MLPLGTSAPDFHLQDPYKKWHSLKDFSRNPVLVVMFICNHCPFVMHIRAGLSNLVKEFQKKDVAFVAINSNDAVRYPADSFEKMADEIKEWGYTFPYLFDETQEVAIAYHAACTPDFFVFDSNRLLTYRGRFDSTRPGSNEPAIGEDLRNAINATLQGISIPEDKQRASIGCNIKWKPGNQPTYT